MGHHCASTRHAEPTTWREANQAFIDHARSFVLVNLLLVAIWAMTDFGGYFWPMWPIFGWGIGLVAHAMGTFNRSWAADEIE